MHFVGYSGLSPIDFGVSVPVDMVWTYTKRAPEVFHSVCWQTKSTATVTISPFPNLSLCHLLILDADFRCAGIKLIFFFAAKCKRTVVYNVLSIISACVIISRSLSPPTLYSKSSSTVS